MKTVRTNCFETNSSSTHSFTLDTSYSDATFIRNELYRGVEITAGEFGWEWRKFNDFRTKASYFWTLVAGGEGDYVEKYMPGLRARMERLAKKYGFVLVKPCEKDFVYVDHGSDHYPNFIKKDKSLNTDDGLWEFLTNPSYWIMLGNDNGLAPCNFRLTPNQIAGADRYLVFTVKPKEKWAIFRDTDVPTLVEHAALAYFDNTPYERGWPHIDQVAEAGVTVEFRKYDYEKKEDIILSKETLTYKITS